jgi:hypothetical protein
MSAFIMSRADSSKAYFLAVAAFAAYIFAGLCMQMSKLPACIILLICARLIATHKKAPGFLLEL